MTLLSFLIIKYHYDKGGASKHCSYMDMLVVHSDVGYLYQKDQGPVNGLSLSCT